MAIIKASPSFQGSDLTGGSFGRIVKEGTRLISFREDKNKAGNHFFLLPAYKLDQHGNGVWFKVLRTRSEFGIDTRETFVAREDDPVSYFASQVKLHFPSYAQIEEQVIGGKKIKKYPTYGRISTKVVYNAAYASELNLGAHALIVPEYYVGQTIEGWGRGKAHDGSARPMLNDHTHAIPIKLQLRKDAQGQPWLIEIDASKSYVLPDQLADSDYLYNLDEVIHYPEHDYLLTKLRSITPSEIFDTCMQGWFQRKGNTAVAGVGGFKQATPVVAAESVAAPGVVNLAPAFSNIPKANTATLAPAAPVAQAADNIPFSFPAPATPTLAANASVAEMPAPAGTGMTVEQARNFLLTPRKA